MIPGLLQITLIAAVVVGLHVPLGDYMAGALDGGPHRRVERVLYRACGVDPDREQDWRHYLFALLAFTLASIAALFALLTLQGHLPWSLGHPGMPWRLALHTAVSFTTNTSWQNYAAESTTGHLAVMAGLGTQAFASAAVGICVALALVRGLVRRDTDRLGNFWVDLIRTILRILLPLAVLSGIVLVALGVPQSLGGPHTVATVAGGRQTLLGGPVGSWEPIKLLSGDGGGAFNASSAHPFENPSSYTNAIEIVLMLLIPTAFIRTYGRMIGSLRQSWTLLAVVGILFGRDGGLQRRHRFPQPVDDGGDADRPVRAHGVPARPRRPAGPAAPRRRHRRHAPGPRRQLRRPGHRRGPSSWPCSTSSRRCRWGRWRRACTDRPGTAGAHRPCRVIRLYRRHTGRRHA
ncbi:hypothetical protein Sm713_60490 [Streptomyces sp. TS71-3]|nr:hypothetical protein Sm713_60490 [Streptomyces sp. TS71-3]